MVKKTKPDRELLGGQALIEGVMMKGSTALGYAVYAPNGQLCTSHVSYTPWKKKYPLLGWFFIRGSVNLFEMLMIGMKALDFSVSIALPGEYKQQSKYEMPLAIVMSLLFSFGLFMVLPAFSFTLLQKFIQSVPMLNFLEGLVRIAIFVLFLFLVGFSRDMRRLFGYHGAEHMTVHAYEAEEELTIANVRKYSTLHPRCGTSFLLIVFIISIVFLSGFGHTALLLRLGIKLAMFPVITGVSYELVRLVCRLPRALMLVILSPGLLMQYFTTRRPDDAMLQAAITALNTVKD